MRGFAVREFQLMLLRRMADFRPELVAAACAELGAPHSEYMAAHNRWQSMLHSTRAPRGLDLYRATLGPPDPGRTVAVGDATLTLYRWRLPGLWPQLRWEAVVGAGGAVLDGRLVRDAAAEPPAMRAPDRLAPWSCVVGDVLAGFPDAREVDPQVPFRWVVDAAARRLWFVHGLLQVVAALPARVPAAPGHT